MADILTPSPPVALRLAVTHACDLSCIYCTPVCHPRSPEAYDRLALDDFLWFVRQTCQIFDVRKVHLTGGEPLLRDGLTALIHALATTGVPDLAVSTNGQRLALLSPALAHAGLHRVNVSIDSLRPDVYARITRGGKLDHVLNGISTARAAGLAVKLNMVVLRGVNDDELVDYVHFAMAHHCEVRFLELMPIGCAREFFNTTYLPAAQFLARLANAFALVPQHVQPGQSQRFLAYDAHGNACSIGIIASVSQPFCRGCHRLRLTANGALIGCLARPHKTDIVHLIRARDASRLAATLRDALLLKRYDSSFHQPTSMLFIGG